MKKILIFADSFLPGFKGGGPVTSIVNLVSLLNNDFNILICTRNCDFGDTKPYEGIKSNIVTKYQQYNVMYLSSMDKRNISKVINEFNPDLLYLNSLFSKTTQIVMFLNKFRFNKKMIIAPRGELQENALNIKSTKKSIYLFIYKLLKLYKNIDFHSTDEIETKSIEELFNIDTITQLPNAVKIQNFEPLTKNKDELKIVFISRISPKKNLLFALEILKDTKVNISFDIYGPKEDVEYWDRCKKIIDQLPSNIKVKYQGSLQPNEIIKTLRNYHTFFFPTLSENFGHVIVEAMQSGLVPIISDQTPWLELETQNAGYDISLDDKQKYINTIEELYLSDDKEYTKKSLGVTNYIHNKLDIDKLKKDYIYFFDKIILIDNKQ
jgi:glycosyltransferase involved in cell wall biosynthesis